MDKTKTVALSKIGIFIMIGGLVLMLLSFLDYLQDGKSDSGIFTVLLVITGSLMYLSGRKSKAQDE